MNRAASNMRKRDYQRERWTQYGLIARKQTHQAGRRGSSTVYGADTAAREAIIVAYLDEGHTLQQTANELILLGYDSYRPAPVRDFLVAYCHAQDWLSSLPLLPQRHRQSASPQPTEAVQRAR